LSQALFEEAKKVFPGGVNSPARLLRPYPFFVKRGKGSKLYTVDNTEYIDYCLAFGPLILGHANEEVITAIRDQLERGWLYGAPYEVELKLAKEIMKYFPTIEMIRFVNSGTEATMNAIRVARGYTRRKKIVKFEGNYHGSHEAVLVKAGSSTLTFGIPTSEGVPEDIAKHTLVAPYNNLEATEKLAETYANDLAAVIVEPIAVNMGLILPDIDFLKGLREVCNRYGALLISDEVVTGFRFDLGGAQGYYGIEADLTTLGKIIGGGFPIGAFGGRREFMEVVAPLGRVHNAGTFNAHPVSLAAGLKTIEMIRRNGVVEKAAKVAEEVSGRLKEAVEDRKVRARVYQIASMFQIFFTEREVRNFDDVNTSDKELFMELHRILMEKGVYWAPSQFETCFTSSAHTKEDVELTSSAIEEALDKVRTG
jgi:glutamate-1-semialdehyde 2,1-aminomutase